MAQRNTKQRELVLDVVRSRFDHPTADQIYAEVHGRDPHVGRATVYRNLRVLEEKGDILRVNGLDANRFDYRLDDHSHMQCQRCGAIVDAPVESVGFNYADIENATGYQVQGHQVMFVGICPECQENG